MTEYVLLGRSGLRVSRACLGTMTFGTEWGWGSAEDAAREIFNRFLDSGQNFIDTADGYTGGTSEEFIGRFMKDRRERDRIVLATKYTFSGDPKNPNAGGNGRKNLLRALEGSLRRLQMDYIDLYWVHNWDRMTPVEEMVSAIDDAVRSGKVRYFGISNAPAWYISRAKTLADLRATAPPVALQLEYSLLERSIEPEFTTMMSELGLGLCPWSPMAGGMLSGKYRREKGTSPTGEGRLPAMEQGGNPAFLKLLTERNWTIVDKVVALAEKAGMSPAQMALAWVAGRPSVSSTIIGATKVKQLEDNLAAFEQKLPEDVRKELDEVSAPETRYPYHFFEPTMQAMVHGGLDVRRE